MLWYKSWLETRWRFVIGLVVLDAVGVQHRRRLPGGAATAAAGAADARPAARSAGALPRPLSCRATTAATCGRSGSGRTCRSNGRSLRCCSVPAGCSRSRRAAGHSSRCRCRSRAADCSGFAPPPALAELLVLAIVPSLVLPLLSPAVGETLQRRRRAGPRRVHVHRGRGVLQPGVSALDRVQRRLAAAADRALRVRSSSAWSNRFSAGRRASACSG